MISLGIAILPSYLIGRDMTRGRLVRLLGEYRLPQVEINIAYPSRHHLPAKVRTFIDHLVEHFSQTPNSLLGEQWIKDGQEWSASGLDSSEMMPPEAFDGAEPLSRLLDSEISPKLSAKTQSSPRARPAVASSF